MLSHKPNNASNLALWYMPAHSNSGQMHMVSGSALWAYKAYAMEESRDAVKRSHTQEKAAGTWVDTNNQNPVRESPTEEQREEFPGEVRGTTPHKPPKWALWKTLNSRYFHP